MSKSRAAITIGILCLLAACDRPVKLAQTSPPVTDSTLVLPPPKVLGEVVPETDAAQWPENLPLLSKTYGLQKNFRTFSGRAKVHFEGNGQSQDFNANIRIQKDEKIWLSINALGLLEVFRAVLTPESLQAVNRLDKIYYEAPVSEVSNILPVAADFQTVQHLLLGGVLGEKGSVLQVAPAGDKNTVLVQRPDFQQVLILTGDSTLYDQRVFEAGVQLDLHYERYKASGNYLFPYTQVLQVKAPDNDVLLQLNYDKAVLDEPVEMPYSVPKKYKQGKLKK